MADLKRPTRALISARSGVGQALDGVEGSVRTVSISSLMLGRYSLYVESSLRDGRKGGVNDV